jgi:hypothetical protein
MRKLPLLVVALGIVAAPAFAQPATNGHHRTRSSHQQPPQQSYTYGYKRNNNLNPDFQLGGSWWRTNSKRKAHSRHHG